jgi:hypothetical protein
MGKFKAPKRAVKEAITFFEKLKMYARKGG